jgi:hypothetical protein
MTEQQQPPKSERLDGVGASSTHSEESEQARRERLSAEERKRHAEVTRRLLEARFGNGE